MKHMKILIADDDAEYRESLQEVLESGGHTVITANDGESAVTTYQRNDGVGLIITDYNMPKKNGLTVVREIRNIQPKARIWLISNAMTSDIKKAAIESGAEQSMWKTDIRNELRQWNIVS